VGAALLLRGGGPGGEPTPFPGATLYTDPEGLVQVAVPEGWQEQQLPAEDGLAVLWAPADGSAFAALRLAALEAAAEDAFTAQVERYDRAAYGDARLFVPIDRAAQPGDRLRISYRVPQPAALYGRFGPGQLDLIYGQTGPHFVVLEFFTGDGADVDALLPVLQSVLDSVVFNSAG